MNKGDVLQRAKTAYAAGAQKAGQALAKMGLVGDTPPERDRRLRHWAYSLTRVHDSLAIAELDVPWWTYRAVDVVDAWLSARKRPIRVFEYGSGASTLWLARRTDEVYSVEHHRGFGDYIAPMLAAQGNIDFRIVEPVTTTQPAVPSAKEGHSGLDFTDYVGAIDGTEGLFDLVVIDGRAREACLRAALPRLAPDGIIVFDNSRRARYEAAIRAASVHERRLPGLTPTLPYPEQTSVLTRTS
ncbi:MAG: SAM-dependent methyltransferase [Pseudonocardiales bacterium]|nr:MAG: SAM-dependent methyltransferase [Pseudonocardiales bacterium]